jgi:DNA-binding CsgD family transcriptional regulator
MVTISKREFEVLVLISQGLSTKEIATELNLSEETIKTHRKNLYNKFLVKNSPHLIQKAFSEGYLKINPNLLTS